jgi:type II secretory pathway component GspD/PulD (secretin)
MTLKQARHISTQTLIALALTLIPLTLASHAQDKSAETDCRKLPTHEQRNECADANAQIKTIFLKNITNQNDANEIMVAIRNTTDPGMKIYLLASQNAIVVTSYPEELARVEAMVRTLDRPKKAYRLTYTITELDAGKPIGTEHLSMVVFDGQHTSVKEGDKIPIATGSYSDGSATASGVQTQFTYLDVGMNFDATLNEYDDGALLKTKVEQSSLGQPSTIAGVQEPVVRQTVFDGISFLTLGKPVMLGSIDVPTTTRRLDIAVVLEQIK